MMVVIIVVTSLLGLLVLGLVCCVVNKRRRNNEEECFGMVNGTAATPSQCTEVLEVFPFQRLCSLHICSIIFLIFFLCVFYSYSLNTLLDSLRAAVSKLLVKNVKMPGGQYYHLKNEK